MHKLDDEDVFYLQDIDAIYIVDPRQLRVPTHDRVMSLMAEDGKVIEEDEIFVLGIILTRLTKSLEGFIR